jgi:hypothetical protein
MLKLPDNCECQNGCNPDNEGGLVWYTDGSKTSSHWCWGVQVGCKKRHSFSLGLHIAVFQAEICAIKACVMENIEKGYRGRNIYSF